MKIIQSLKIDKSISDNCGWLSPEFNWMSWALSCLQIKKIHGNIELYTNSNGKNILIDILGLPYSKVHVVFDDITLPHPQLWAYTKLIAYQMQDEPFLHIDGDVFLWEKFDDFFLNKAVFAQNIEVDAENYYSDINLDVKLNNFWLPPCIVQQQEQQNQLFAYNCGIIGGHDVGFFKKYTSLAIEFLEKNKSKIAQLSIPTQLNVFFEQYLLYCLLKQEKIEPGCYFQLPTGPMNYTNYAFVNFIDVPYKTKYIHPLGTYKRNLETCLLLSKRLLKDYPEYYYRILDACRRAGVATVIKSETHQIDNKSIVHFYKTKASLARCDIAAIKEIKNTEIPNIISQIRNIEEKKILLNLYEFEKESTLINTEVHNHDQHYSEQENQTFLLEEVFSQKEKLNMARFSLRDSLQFIDVNMDYTFSNKQYLSPATEKKYKICFAYEALLGGIREIFCDELDILLLTAIEKPKTVEELKTELIRNFNIDEVAQNPASFDFLILSRLKFAISNNLVLCMPNEIHSDEIQGISKQQELQE